MKPKLISGLALVLMLVAMQRAWARSTDIHVTPGNLKDIPPLFKVKVQDENGVRRFHVAVDPQGAGAGTALHGVLEIYDGQKLISSCVVASGKLPSGMHGLSAALQERGVDFEFAVATNYLAASKFKMNYFQTNAPAFDGYWFYLKDFCDEK